MTVWIEAPFDSLPIEGYRKQRYWLLSEAFVRAGHRVVYWTSDFSHATKRTRNLDGLKADGIEVRFVPTKPYAKNVGLARILSHRAYAREWERLAEGSPDLLVVSTPPLSTGAAALRLKRKLGAKLVVDIQDVWPETFYRLLPRGFRWAAALALRPAKYAAMRLLRGADLVTGVCDRYRTLALDAGARDYFRAYLGRERIVQAAKAAGTALPHSAPLRLVYVGNLGASYDLKTVVRGLGILRERGVEAALDVAGFGSAPTGVRFHGMLGAAELDRLLVSCDIGVVPMRDESFVGVPNKFCDYAAAGLRIVSSLGGESAALLKTYGCGVTYRAGDAASFADAVQRAQNCMSSSALFEDQFEAVRIYDDYVRRVS